MKELHTILTDNVGNEKGITVAIDGGIPKTRITIHQSLTMILYGIGKQNEPGFALCISVESKSNKGKRINAELSNNDALRAFSTFSKKGSTIYVCDFKTDVSSIVAKTNDVLNCLKPFASGGEINIVVTTIPNTHTLK